MRAEMTLLDIVVHAIGRERGGGGAAVRSCLGHGCIINTRSAVGAHLQSSRQAVHSISRPQSSTVKLSKEKSRLAGWGGHHRI